MPNPFDCQKAFSKDLADTQQKLSVVSTAIHATGGQVFTHKWGSSGSGDGQFSTPREVAVRGEEVYVADNANDRIQVFDLDGVFKRKWGSAGSDDGEFGSVHGLHVHEGEVYTTDIGPDRIQVFNTAGTFQRKWGVAGSADGEFLNPTSVYVYKDEVFVSESVGDRVQVFNTAGTFQRKWGSSGSSDGQFDFARTLWVHEDEVYVLDSGNDRVQVFNIAGTFQRKWSIDVNSTDGLSISLAGEVFVGESSSDSVEVYDTQGNSLRSFGSGGSGDGQFDILRGVTVAGPHIYVSDTGANQRIQVFLLTKVGFGDAWFKYGSKSTQQRAFTEVGGPSFGPADDWLTVPIEKIRLATGEQFAPFNIKLIRDARVLIEKVAGSGRLINKLTGNTLTWDYTTANDLYKTAVQPFLADIGATGGNQFNWQRGLGSMVGDVIRSQEVTELKLCADFLHACAVSDGLITL